MFKFSGSQDEILRALALDELAQTVSLCSEKASVISVRLLQGCADEDLFVRAIAKKNLGHVLPFCADLAVRILERVIWQQGARLLVHGHY